MYRREVLSSLNSRKYDDCFGALNALNGLLPSKYRVIISTDKYALKTKEAIKAICTECEQEIDYSTVSVLEVLCPLLTQAISGQKTERIWVCPSCKAENKVTQTQLIKESLQEPYFLKVVPNPPERKDGLVDRTNYHAKVSQWVWLTLGEVEAQMAQFRDDNWHKGDEMFEADNDVIEGGEEFDDT